MDSNHTVTADWGAFMAFKNGHDSKIEAQFDEEIRNKLVGQVYPITDVANELFNGIASNYLSNNKHVWISKLFEAAMIAAIFLLLITYWPILDQQIHRNDSDPELSIAQTSNVDQLSEKSMRNLNTSPPSSNKISALGGADNSKKATFKKYKKNTNASTLVNAKNPLNSTFEAHSKYSDTNIEGIVSINMEDGLNLIQKNKEIASEQIILATNKTEDPDLNPSHIGLKHNQENVQLGAYNQEDQVLSERTASNMNYAAMNSLERKDFTPISIYSDEKILMYRCVNINDIVLKNNPIKIWAGLKIGPVVNWIKTPFINLEERSFERHQTISAIEGFNFEVENNWLSIETGLSHSKKMYGLGNPQNESGHFLTLPLLFKKEFKTKNNVNPYAKIGGSMTIEVQSKYDPNQNSTTTDKNFENFSPSLDYISSKIVQQRNLSSGKLVQNAYFGIIGALGVEKKISNKVKMEAEVSHLINPFNKGIGYNNHIFSETMFTVGIKTQINN